MQATTPHGSPQRFAWRRWLRFGLLAGVVLVGMPAACDLIWKARHPAPLGRSQEAVERTLARDLPAGTPLPAVAAYLDGHGVDFSIDSAGGRRTLAGMARDVDVELFVTKSVGIDLEFDPAWRLTRRRTRSVLTGM